MIFQKENNIKSDFDNDFGNKYEPIENCPIFKNDFIDENQTLYNNILNNCEEDEIPGIIKSKTKIQTNIDSLESEIDINTKVRKIHSKSNDFMNTYELQVEGVANIKLNKNNGKIPNLFNLNLDDCVMINGNVAKCKYVEKEIVEINKFDNHGKNSDKEFINLHLEKFNNDIIHKNKKNINNIKNFLY